MLELGLLLFARVIPSLLLIIPNNNFGLTSAMSWVKSYKNEACQPPRGVTMVLWMIFSMYTVMNIFNLMVYAILVGVFLGGGGGGGGGRRLAFELQIGRMQYLVTARRKILLELLLKLCTGVHLFSIFIYLVIMNKGSKIHQKC